MSKKTWAEDVFESWVRKTCLNLLLYIPVRSKKLNRIENLTFLQKSDLFNSFKLHF